MAVALVALLGWCDPCTGGVQPNAPNKSCCGARAFVHGGNCVVLLPNTTCYHIFLKACDAHDDAPPLRTHCPPANGEIIALDILACFVSTILPRCRFTAASKSETSLEHGGINFGCRDGWMDVQVSETSKLGYL